MPNVTGQKRVSFREQCLVASFDEHTPGLAARPSADLTDDTKHTASNVAEAERDTRAGYDARIPHEQDLAAFYERASNPFELAAARREAKAVVRETLDENRSVLACLGLDAVKIKWGLIGLAAAAALLGASRGLTGNSRRR